MVIIVFFSGIPSSPRGMFTSHKHRWIACCQAQMIPPEMELPNGNHAWHAGDLLVCWVDLACRGDLINQNSRNAWHLNFVKVRDKCISLVLLPSYLTICPANSILLAVPRACAGYRKFPIDSSPAASFSWLPSHETRCESTPRPNQSDFKTSYLCYGKCQPQQDYYSHRHGFSFAGPILIMLVAACRCLSAPSHVQCLSFSR